MKAKKLSICFALICLVLSGGLQAQEETAPKIRKISIDPGIGLTYFSRTVTCEEEQDLFGLTSYFIHLVTEVEIQDGFFINAVLGISYANFDEFTFRKLPISIDLNVGDIRGYLFGIEAKKDLLRVSNFQLRADGQFLYYLSDKETWTIPELNVEGSVNGTSQWMKAMGGVSFMYTGFTPFVPFLQVSYDQFWGKFNMDQSILSLSGSEEKKFNAVNDINVSLGTVYDIADSLSLRAMVMLLPYDKLKKFDWGFTIRILYIL